MSVTDWSDDFLDSLRTQADPPADDIVAGIFAGTADATSAFRTLVVQQHEVSDPALAAFLEGKDDPPAWVDPELVAAGQEQQRIVAATDQHRARLAGAKIFFTNLAAVLAR